VSSDFDLALAHYRLLFPTLASLGAAPGCGVWRAEYDRLVKSGLSAMLIVQSSTDGGNTTATRNYDQKELLRAVLTRRAELDTDFDDLIFAPVSKKSRRRLGITVRLGCN